MPLGIWNVNWLNQNATRAYPISIDGSRQTEIDPSIKLPNDFILALKFSYHSGHSVKPDKFYISAVSVTATGCQIRVGYSDGETRYDVATANIPAQTEALEHTLSGIGEFYDTVGYIAVDMRHNIARMPSGYYTFAPDATPLEPDCLTPMLRGVSSLVVNNQGSYSERLMGDVVLEAGINVDLKVVSYGSYGSKVIISAIDSSNMEESCVCCVDDNLPSLTSINGIYADSNGNIELAGTDCMNITTGTSRINFGDKCAEPCCGCAEANALKSEMNVLATGVATMRSFSNTLNTVVRDTRMIIASSSTGDGCCDG